MGEKTYKNTVKARLCKIYFLLKIDDYVLFRSWKFCNFDNSGAN